MYLLIEFLQQLLRVGLRGARIKVLLCHSTLKAVPQERFHPPDKSAMKQKPTDTSPKHTNAV